MTHQMLIPEQLEFIKELDAVQVEVILLGSEIGTQKNWILHKWR